MLATGIGSSFNYSLCGIKLDSPTHSQTILSLTIKSVLISSLYRLCVGGGVVPATCQALFQEVGVYV